MSSSTVATGTGGAGAGTGGAGAGTGGAGAGTGGAGAGTGGAGGGTGGAGGGTGGGPLCVGAQGTGLPRNCSNLPTAPPVVCPNDDAAAYQLCNLASMYLPYQDGNWEDLYACLFKIQAADVCSSQLAHDCLNKTIADACDNPASAADCAQIGADCIAAGDPSFNVSACVVDSKVFPHSTMLLYADCVKTYRTQYVTDCDIARMYCLAFES